MSARSVKRQGREPGALRYGNVSASYDSIGLGYSEARNPDPRIAEAVLRALGDAGSVLNVGAGAGSYEPADRHVVAVEPSTIMTTQRSMWPSAVVRASATSLPFRSHSFDAVMALLTVHHWPDPMRGLRELRRVSRGRVVVLTWDPAAPGFWLTDYFPEILEIDRPAFPPIADFERALGPVRVQSIPVPDDCTDGFLGAHWRRPAAYLDPRVRAAISTFSRLPGIKRGLARLRADLDSGIWRRTNGHLLTKTELDLGYRLIVSCIGPDMT